MAKRAVLVLAAIGWMNASQAPPVFDVASIRPSDPAVMRDGCYMKGQPGGQTFVGRCIPMRLILKYAYKIIDSQIVGGPAWMDSELYDFEAKSERSVTRAEVAGMFQSLLADRFKLQFHRESRTLPSFVLTVDKSGQKMKANDSSYEWEIPVQGVPGPIPKIKGTRCPMSYLSWWIGQQENRPVVDQTALGGFWDFTMEYIPEGFTGRRSPGGDAVSVPDGPNLVAALREQLGLKLEPQKGPVDVYVIDHAEKATNN